MEQLKHSVNTTVLAMNIRKIVVTFRPDPFAVTGLFKGNENDYAFSTFFPHIQFIITSNFVFNITKYNLQVLGSLNTYDS